MMLHNHTLKLNVTLEQNPMKNALLTSHGKRPRGFFVILPQNSVTFHLKVWMCRICWEDHTYHNKIAV